MLVGGAAKMLSFVANSFDTYGYDVDVVTMFDCTPCDNLNSSIKQTQLVLSQKRLFWRIAAFFKIRRTIKNISSPVVCAFISDVCVMTRIATIGLPIFFASAERGDPFAYKKIWQILEKWTFKKSDICYFQVEKAKSFFDRCNLKRTYVIPNPFILKKDVLPYYGTRNKTIIGAGRLEDQKGFDLLISAFARIHSRYPEYTLIIYGDGSKKEILQQQAKELDIADFIEFPGYVDDLADRLKNEGIYVLSSRYEGMPNSLIEALSVGIPSIAANCSPGGPSYLTKNGERGLLVEVENVDALAGAIELLINNKELYNRLNIEGPKIREELDVNKIRGNWIESIEQILQLI